MTTPRPKRAKFEPRGQGPLALAPWAFGFFFDIPEPPRNEMRDHVAIVAVRGPLMHHEDWLFDSYDAIGMRLLEALEARPTAIVLSIDSPGGLVSGCFETADQIRELCARAGVPVYAYVDGQATSAAYALACAADHIAAPATATVGSVGVLAELVDETARLAAMGVKVQLVSSGARKTDGQWGAPITDGAIAATQRVVDAMARTFFDHVARARRSSPEAVAALEAAVMTAQAGMAAGLVDQVATLDQLLAGIASGKVPTTEEKTMTTKAAKASKAYEDAIATLRKCAEGDDEEAAKAKKMLQAELADDATPPPEDEEQPADEEPAEDASAKGEDAQARSMAAQALAKTRKLEEDQTKAAIAAERRDLLASRPDLPTELVEVLRKPTASVETVREIVKTHPRGKLPNPAAAAQAIGTRGAGQGGLPTVGMATPSEIDIAMGLAKPASAIHYEAGRVVFPTMTPAAAKAALEQRQKERATQGR